MKLEFLSFDFDKFATEMQNLKDQNLVQKKALAVSISSRIRTLMSVVR